jgi:hypothetical protein
MTSTWIQTATDIAFDPIHPDPQLVSLEDIAHSLSMQCRFAGHIHGSQIYSVAQHCVHVYQQVAQWTKHIPALKAALLHDASEAYLVDLPAPLKNSELGPVYYQIERRVSNAIGDRFGVCLVPVPLVVQHADLVMRETERRDLKGPAPRPWDVAHVDPATRQVQAWGSTAAKREFLNACRQLGIV